MNMSLQHYIYYQDPYNAKGLQFIIEDNFLSDRIPKSIKYKIEDAENEYKTARKRTTTAHSKKLLFQA
jgi:hypothetical protein